MHQHSHTGAGPSLLKYTFDHVGLLAGTSDLARECDRFYRENFGLQSVVPFGDSPEDDFCMLSDGTTPEVASLEIIGQVFEDREREFIAAHGPGLDHLSFDTNDVDRAYDSLSAAGVAIPIPPYSFLNTRLMCCKDPVGNDIKVTQGEPRVKSGVDDASPHAVNARLDHVGILVDGSEQAQELKRFYMQHFGMCEHLHGDLWQQGHHRACLESSSGINPFRLQILGDAPFKGQRAFLDARGPGMDHLCFLVEDAGATRQALQARGVQIERAGKEHLSQRMFTAWDPAGLMVQFVEAPGRLG